MEHGVEYHKIRDRINVKVGFTLGETIMEHVKLFFSKEDLLMRGAVD